MAAQSDLSATEEIQKEEAEELDELLKADGVIARDLKNVKVERIEEQHSFTRKEIEIDE